MSHENLKRRDFIKGAATAGLSAPLLAGESLAETSRQNQLAALGQARPVVIASENGANVPKRGVEPRGVSCVELAMRMLKEGRDTLEAVVAGVNIVEDDPDDDSVGYGGLPNEDCVVELDASVMHGPTRRAGAVANLHRIKKSGERRQGHTGADGSHPAGGRGRVAFRAQTWVQGTGFADRRVAQKVARVARKPKPQRQLGAELAQDRARGQCQNLADEAFARRDRPQ